MDFGYNLPSVSRASCGTFLWRRNVFLWDFPLHRCQFAAEADPPETQNLEGLEPTSPGRPRRFPTLQKAARRIFNLRWALPAVRTTLEFKTCATLAMPVLVQTMLVPHPVTMENCRVRRADINKKLGVATKCKMGVSENRGP